MYPIKNIELGEPFLTIIEPKGGNVAYLNAKRAGELLGRSGLQLPRLPSLNIDRSKILTEKNLAGYRSPLAKGHQAEPVLGLSRTPATKAAYEERIDESFAVGKVKHVGVKI